MRLTAKLLIPLAVLVSTGVAFCQDDDKAKLKKEILQKVEEMIKAEEARILKNIEALLDKELGKGGDHKDQPTGKSTDKPADKPTDKPAEKPAEKTNGKKRGFLGVRPGELTDDEREELKIKPDEGGVKIGEVIPDTAADGKLEADDVILKVNGEKVADVQALVAALQGAGAGTEVTLSIVREGKRSEVKIKLGIHPDDQDK
jgi:C-terminal processing protease CtpA/Prc